MHQTSTAYCHQQNGLAERTIRTLTEKARCMMYDANLGKDFWAEAINTAAYVKNRTVSKTLRNKTPMELWTGEKPNVSHMKIFGSRVMAHVPVEKRRKFDPRSKEYLFVGYCDEKKGYRLVDPKTKGIIESRDVVFLESGNIFDSNTNYEFVEFPFKGSDDPDTVEQDDDTESVSSAATVIERNEEIQQELSNDSEPIDDSLSHNAVEPSDPFENTLTEYGSDDDDSEWNDSTISELEITQIRKSSREVRPVERFEAGMLALSAGAVFEPFTVSEAMQSDEHVAWKRAMDSEYESLIENNTWELTDLPPDRKAINNKWVFKQKYDGNGSKIRYKARLVAKGCSQREGVDYKETFSPVIRYSSIRFLMALAVRYKLKIEQMDAVTAFLQGDIDETIYMRQPEMYDDGSGRVCKLKRSIYGLKQASRQWNLKLSQALIDCGFIQCQTDSCIYIRRHKFESLIIVAVYVDDLLIFYNNNEWRTELKKQLTTQFRMKDLGEASNILGIRMQRDATTIKLDQRRYIEDILKRFNMGDSNPVKTPADPNQKLTAEMSPSTPEEVAEMEAMLCKFSADKILQ